MELIKLMQEFEERNDICIAIDLCADGSGDIKYFCSNERIKAFDSYAELKGYLLKGRIN